MINQQINYIQQIYRIILTLIAIWFLNLIWPFISDVILMLVFAFLFTTLLLSSVDTFERKIGNRGLSVLGVVIILLTSISTFIGSFISQISIQAQEFSERVDQDTMMIEFKALGDKVASAMPTFMKSEESSSDYLANKLTEVTQSILGSLGSLVSIVGNFMFIAVMVFIFTIIVGPLPVALRLVDVYYGTNIIPSNGSDTLWYILAIHQTAMAALGALGFVFITSMSMDIVEQVEKSTDRREEGLLGTINAFVHKLVGAGGVLISGLIISFAGFDNPNALQADLYGGDIINNFAIIHLAIGISLPFISTLLVLLYDIDRSKHNTHVSDLGYVEED